MKIAVVFGTRPELIKMAPIIQELKVRKLDHAVIHSGQHEMESLINDLNIGKHINLNLTLKQKERGLLGTALSSIIWILKSRNKLKKILKSQKITHILYHGDTLTCLVGYLSSRKYISGHIEAGIRTYDWRNPFPEEIIRKFVARKTDYNFAPTKTAVKNLKNENVNGKIYLVGNTIVDSVNLYKKISDKKRKPIIFIHRQENVQTRDGLKKVLDLLKKVNDVIYLEHPTTIQKMKNFGFYEEYMKLNVERHGFYNYVEFLNVLSNCPYIITDSGGIQEETAILKVPCIVWRKKTEREEALEAGNTVLVGNNIQRTLYYVDDIKNKGNFYKKVKNTKNPFGDGKSSKRIIDILSK